MVTYYPAREEMFDMYEGDLDNPATKRDLKEVDERLSAQMHALSGRVDVLSGTVDALSGTLSALSGTVHEMNASFIERYELLRSEMNHGYRDLADRINDSETRLLKAFYAFADSNNTRVQAIEESEAGTRDD